MCLCKTKLLQFLFWFFFFSLIITQYIFWRFDKCSFFSCSLNISILGTSSPSHPIFNLYNHPSAWPPDTAGCISQLLDYCHGTISSGKACQSPNYSAPLCPRSVASQRHSWRLHPSGSAPDQGGSGHSSRPVTTKGTWRSEDRKKR